MTQWEYIVFICESFKLADELNELGNYGWRLISYDPATGIGIAIKQKNELD